MKNNKKGFTLIELLVVVIIMGILASVSVPYYYKTLEVSKADDAMGMGHMLGNSYRMYRVDNAAALSGTITNACNAYTCATVPLAPNPCRLVACNYTAKQDWDSASYTYSLNGNITSTRRRNGSSPGTNVTPYTSWGYDFDDSGVCSPVGGAPNCSGF